MAISVGFDHSHQSGALAGDAFQFGDIVSVGSQVNFRPSQVFVQGPTSCASSVTVRKLVFMGATTMVSGVRFQVSGCPSEPSILTPDTRHLKPYKPAGGFSTQHESCHSVRTYLLKQLMGMIRTAHKWSTGDFCKTHIKRLFSPGFKFCRWDKAFHSQMVF